MRGYPAGDKPASELKTPHVIAPLGAPGWCECDECRWVDTQVTKAIAEHMARTFEELLNEE